MKRLQKFGLVALIGLSSISLSLADALFVYAGAGLKKPMDEIAALYKENNNIEIVFNYAGSGQLLTQLETTKKGDVFLVGADIAYTVAQKKNLVNEPYSISHHTPAIVVLKGNPKNIQKIEDLNQSGIKVILGDENASAIGKTAQNILQKNGLESINDNVVSKANTVNEMVIQLTLGNADAMIATVDSVFNNPEVEIITIDPDKNIDQIVTGGVISSSTQLDNAKAFMEFVASDKGKEIFARYGFASVK